MSKFKPFTFTDDHPWPYLVQEIGGGLWLCYWSEAYKSFALLRTITTEEAERFRVHAMTEEQAALYDWEDGVCLSPEYKIP